MGRNAKKKKHGCGQPDSSIRQLAPGGEAKDEKFDEGALGEESDKEGILTIEVSCTPYGSKLKKPTDFFKAAFASIVKPYVNYFEIKSVSYAQDDTFLVITSMKYFDGK